MLRLRSALRPLFPRLALTLVPVLGLACAAPTDESAEPIEIGTTSAALTAVDNFGTNPASLTMAKYVPQGMPTDKKPLVVVLHGCTQTAATYESAGWNQLADEWKFYVVYPGQNTAKNNSSGCFNWGGRWKSAPSAFVLSPEALELDEIKRGNGENESIKEMVDKMKADHPIDDKRVFVTGLSAGGAMTALLLATWPDVFSAGAIFAGIPYGCATSQKTTTEASNCMKDFKGTNAYLARTPEGWGDLVRGAAPNNGVFPRVQIWHGTSDFVVNPASQAELVKQWTNVHGLTQTPSGEDTVDGAKRQQYKDQAGVVRVETFSLAGKGHGTPVAAQKPVNPANAGGPKCGKAASYITESGICGTYYAGKFFGLDLATAETPNGSTGEPGQSPSGTNNANGNGPGNGNGAGNGNGDGNDGKLRSAASTCTTSAPGAFGPSSLAVVGLAALGAALARRRRAA